MHSSYSGEKYAGFGLEISAWMQMFPRLWISVQGDLDSWVVEMKVQIHPIFMEAGLNGPLQLRLFFV